MEHLESYDVLNIRELSASSYPNLCKELINRYNSVLKDVLKNPNPTYKETFLPLIECDYKLTRVFEGIGHLFSVFATEDVCKNYEECEELVTEFSSDLGHNTALYQSFVKFSQSAEFEKENQAVVQYVNDVLLDFELHGIDLSDDKKEEHKKLSLQLSKLTTAFSNNTINGTDSYSLNITDESRLQGVDKNILAALKMRASTNEREGWDLSIAPAFLLPIMEKCEDQDIRAKLYYNACVLCSELAEGEAVKFDNTENCYEILNIRQQIANILNKDNYAKISLAPKMAESSEDVIHFLRDIAVKVKDKAADDYNELVQYAKNKCGIADMQLSDLRYVSEKLKQEKYSFDSEEVKKYFPLTKVISGLFELVESTFGIRVVASEKKYIPYHEDVTLYEMHVDNELRGYFYCDLFARDKKRQGAWANTISPRLVDTNGKLHLPVNLIVCNFAKNVEGETYLTHDDVVTLFHEFGHVTHMTVTTVDIPDISGATGFAWDAVELPSQFMENFAYEYEVLQSLSEHVETKQPISIELFDKIYKAKNFQAGMFLVRQIEFGLFDMLLHSKTKKYTKSDVQDTLDSVRAEVSVLQRPSWDRFANSFSHIFAGGYAAGYYGYLYAEVLSQDAYSIIINSDDRKKAAIEYRKKILEPGSTRPAMDLYLDFAKQKPTVDALLASYGF